MMNSGTPWAYSIQATCAYFTGHLALLVEPDVVQRLRAGSCNQEVKPLKANARGSWLKSNTLATLSIQVDHSSFARF